MKKCVFFFLALCMAGLGLKAQVAYTTINRFAGEKISGIDASGIFKADLSGAAKFFCKTISAQQFEIELSGAAELEIYGKAVSGKLEAAGAAKYDLSGFQTARIDVDLSGATRGKLNVTEQITGEMSGAAKLFYSGEVSTRVNVSGAAILKQQ